MIDGTPKFSYDDVKFSTDRAIVARALKLFTDRKVQDFRELRSGDYAATIIGTEPYKVLLDNKRIDNANCTCYMGQNDQLCKHVLALALYVLHRAKLIDERGGPIGVAKLRQGDACDHIAAALRKIRGYTGSSRVWFAYQRKLGVAAGMIQDAVVLLEPTLDDTKYLWKLVLKLSRKLSDGGVDDSDGIIGNTIYCIIERITNAARADSEIMRWARQHCVEDTGFGFEEDLQRSLSASS